MCGNMRLLTCLVFVLIAYQCEAKFVSVVGQGVIMSPPPSNVLDAPTLVTFPNASTILVHDLSGPKVGGVLYIGGFDEKQVTMQADWQLTPTLLLRAGVTYDSHFLFFHQQTPTNQPVAAAANFTMDNRFVGCTSGDGSDSTGNYEVASTPVFGLDEVIYPTVAVTLRGYEPNDLATGTGTTVISRNSIGQPGDFVRCFSVSCVSDPLTGSPCPCSVNAGSPSSCLGSSAPVCFNSAAALLPNATFTSCPAVSADQNSLVLSVLQCNAVDGCTPSGNGGFCLQPTSSGSARVTIHATAACDCVRDVVVVVPACTPVSNGECSFTTKSDECPSVSVSSATNSVGIHFDESVPATQC